MPVLNGIEATRQIVKQHPAVRVVVISAFSERQQMVDAIRAGALGYLVKRSDIDEVVLAIRLVRQGNSYFSAEIAGSMDVSELIVEARSTGARSIADSLSGREKEVVQMLAEGLTCRAAAEKLTLSEKTVEGHCANAMRKLGTKTRAELVRAAVRYGIVDLQDTAGY
jgi:DNA-binding NarL/FixJ family response regulator